MILAGVVQGMSLGAGLVYWRAFLLSAIGGALSVSVQVPSGVPLKLRVGKKGKKPPKRSLSPRNWVI